MTRQMRVLMLAGVLLVATAFPARPQTLPYVSDVSKRGTTAGAFLEIGVGARALAMGNAFVALADDPTAMYWNVAGLAKLERHGFSFTHNDWIADTKYDCILASFRLGDYGTIGFNLTHFSIGEMRVRTVVAPEGTGEVFNGSDLAFAVAYAINLTDNFSLGVSPKFVQQSIWFMKASAFALDLGVHYRLPFQGFTLGAAMTNFGTDLQLSGDNTLVLYDPDLLTTGNNGRIPAHLQTEKWSLPLNFQVGLSYHAVNSAQHQLVVEVDALHPNNNYESLNLGAEYVFRDRIALRGGYKSLFLEDSEESYTWGAGLRHYLLGNVQVKIDFAYADFGRLENTKKFSLEIGF